MILHELLGHGHAKGSPSIGRTRPGRTGALAPVGFAIYILKFWPYECPLPLATTSPMNAPLPPDRTNNAKLCKHM